MGAAETRINIGLRNQLRRSGHIFIGAVAAVMANPTAYLQVSWFSPKGFEQAGIELDLTSGNGRNFPRQRQGMNSFNPRCWAASNLFRLDWMQCR